MTRLVFRVLGGQENGTPAWQTQLEEPPLLGRLPVPLGCTGQEAEFAALLGSVAAADAVRAAGRRLYDAIVSNADVAPLLTAALQVQPPERYPVFVELATTGAEALPWEAICSPAGDFLGLDERWAVGRMVDSLSPLEPVWRFTPPLRIAAVLSCLGVPAAAEWEALRDACTQDGLAKEVLVLVSEISLEEEIRTNAPPGFSVEFVPSDVADLQARIQAFKPHVLHLFCHGSAIGESPHLQIAVKTDWAAGTTVSTHLLEADEVRQFTARTDNLPWVVVLNSCETATAEGPESAQSVALDLVYRGGIPAVIGMREAVRSDDATLFTEAFYHQLFPELARRVAGVGGDGAPLDWAPLVVDARRRLVKKHHGLLAAAGAGKEWTLPVVYTRPLSFAVQGPAEAPVPPPPAVGVPGPVPPAAPAPGPAPPGPPAGTADHDGAGETPRALRLTIEALTGLRAQVLATGDEELRADIDARLAALTAELDAS